MRGYAGFSQIGSHIANCSWWKTFAFCSSFDNRKTFTVKFFFNKGYKMPALYNFKASEKDTCDMSFPSPSGSLKKQFDRAVIKEAK